MMRWWWFDPAVHKPELERELEVMKRGGIVGVEYKLLNIRCGAPFQPQDRDNLRPVPAGLSGALQLIARGKD